LHPYIHTYNKLQPRSRKTTR